ncbi:carboxy terminal-processing peptidase [Photobacterium sp. GB-27]|uniref:carboxy terminal-processing peptidase n=1 Tax=unclassified Photobacterium TaxID=2628852 RepID=UPI000D162268|nr:MULTISPECIES: carboxy terminal-processing peptidase [unclassified Photobacterium]PSV31284.1 carboxy terminal-processing peptidase [Photobacterium sp. GB-72]PSV37178.1 carboxy terminal-processing peptidase [Photobacterium sp. GB-27]PSV44626.1 carboxy terminal-processing peptidase [Photobacterium sp. GB-36]PSV57147.1 carboxy terminal-processing peptidase [Photobacterium sp. GB-3]PSW73209.1 carboxy terminal-processing peptidase [Photobacterium sp. GB-50]
MNCRFRFSLIAAGMMLAASAQALEAKYSLSDLPQLAPEQQHATASKRVASRFTRSHYKHFSLDDKFSSQVFDRYIEMLDYNKSFLTASDVKQFERWRNQFDDQLKSGDTSGAFDIFNKVLQRRFDRYQFAISQLDTEIKFDKDEDFVIDRSELEWPENQAELNEIWRKRVKYDALNLKLAGKNWKEIQETLGKRYNNAVKRLTQTHSEDVFQLYMNAFSREVDPHTSYLSPRNAEQFQSEMNLSLEGIGAVLQVKDDYTTIQSLVAGGPAASSKKLAAGDRIIGVGQDGEKIVDIIGWRLDDVVQLIKGPKGSKVILDVLPEGKNSKSYTVTIVRDKIRLEDRAVKSEVKTVEGKKIGVIEVPSFYVGLSEDTKKELVKLNEQKVDGVVIDLRNNGGGALTEATALSGLFISSGPVVQVRDSYGRVKVNSDSDNQVFFNGPLTVLINRYSASASEIFAAAMQDYGRAVVLGEQSFGKGTVQQHRSLNHLYDLFDKPLGHVQYTIQKFYRINGGSTQNLGVVPDISFPTAIDPSETGESVEDNALPWDSIKPAKYQQLHNYSSILPKLNEEHLARIKNDMEFGFINEDIKTYKKEKDINRISLNEKMRLAEQDKQDADRLVRLNKRQKVLGKKPFADLDAVPKDYEAPDAYLDEAIGITADLTKIKSS